MANMTRAEAICACTNVIDLVECLDAKLPDQYATSIHDKMQSMCTFVKEEWRGDNVTEKMTTAIQNTWSGLRRWDRDDQHNSDLFYGLQDQDLSHDPLAAAKKAAKKGIEDDGAVPALSQEDRDKLEEMQQAARPALRVVQAPHQQPAQAPHQQPAQAPQKPSLSLHELRRIREHAIERVRTQFQEKAIRVVLVDDIKHGDITNVMRKTSSERTRQLLEAAFCAGKIAGLHALSEDLKDKLVGERGAAT